MLECGGLAELSLQAATTEFCTGVPSLMPTRFGPFPLI